MQNTRKYFAVFAIAASLSMLAACSKSDDSSTAGNGSAGTTQPAAPESTPAPSSGTAPAPAPSSETTPAPSSSSSDPSMSDRAKSAADTVAQKAGEMKNSAGEALDNMGHAIKKGAAEANEKIQGAVGNGTATSTPPTPSSNNH